MAEHEALTIAVWLPDWPVQRVRLERNNLRHAPIVFSAFGGRSEVVAACSAEARRLGVTTGMRTPDAESLAGPGRLTTLPHDASGNRRALTRLAAACERFSPSVALEDANDPEALLLDTRGVAVLWGKTQREGERRLVRAIEEWLQGERLMGIVSMASTASLALAFSRYRRALPEGVSVASGNAKAVLDHLPVEALRVGSEVIDRLRGLGIDTVGVLMQLPRSALPARFGEELTRRLDQLLGTASDPLPTVVSQAPFRVSWPYENAVRNGEVLKATVDRLLDQLAEDLQRRGRGALRVLIRYALEDSKQSALPIALRLFRPTSSARELRELADLQTENLRFPAAVKGIHILVGSTAPLDVRQKTLFDNDAREDEHETAKLINRLANRVGHDRVSRIEKRRSVDPRRSYARLPATDTPPKRFELTPYQAERLRWLPLSMSVDVASRVVVQVNAQGAPSVVAGSRVLRCWGPERVETGWWRGRAIRRDAYWVELESGARLWLTFDLRSRSWLAAGEFA